MVFHAVVVFLFITEQYFTLWIYHSMFNSAPDHGYLDLIYFLTITNKASVSIFTCLFVNICLSVSLG